MWYIAIALLICFTITVLLLTIPIDVTVHVQRSGTLSGRVMIAWLFGKVRLSSKSDRQKNLQSEPVDSKPATSSVPEPEPLPKISRRQTISYIMAILKTRGFVKRVTGLIQDLVTGIRIRALNISGRIGLGDPAETGRFWGILSIVSGITAMIPPVAVLLEPDFEQAVFEIDGRGTFRIIPLRVCLIILLFLLSPPTLRAGWRGLKIGVHWRREKGYHQNVPVQS